MNPNVHSCQQQSEVLWIHFRRTQKYFYNSTLYILVKTEKFDLKTLSISLGFKISLFLVTAFAKIKPMLPGIFCCGPQQGSIEVLRTSEYPVGHRFIYWMQHIIDFHILYAIKMKYIYSF